MKKYLPQILIAALVILCGSLYLKYHTKLLAQPSTTGITSGITSDASAFITGQSHDIVVTSMLTNCKAAMKNDAKTASLSDDFITAWCTCNATEIADHMTVADVNALTAKTKTQAEVIGPIATAAVDTCSKKPDPTATASSSVK